MGAVHPVITPQELAALLIPAPARQRAAPSFERELVRAQETG